MPLHDWSDLGGWEGFHDIWLVELLRCIKPQLPDGYRAHLGSSPALGIGMTEKPDVSVRNWQEGGEPSSTASSESATSIEPDEEVATLTLDPDKSLLISFHGQLRAALEVISLRNKDRPASRAAYLARYLGYLQSSVNLVLVDLHPRPLGFSFAEALTEELHLPRTPLACPMAVAFRVGEPTPDGGRLVATWRRRLAVGQPIPAIPLPVSVREQVAVDLEDTYTRTAADAYLS